MDNIRKFQKGLMIEPVSSTGIDTKGEIETLSTGGKLNYHNGTTASPMVTEAHTATLTNKTLTSPSITTPTGIVKGDVGLGNVDNTSDATKNAASVTLTNKTLTSPSITTPTGIVKGDVGLGNVDNTSDATKNAASVSLTNKTIGSGNILTGATAVNLVSGSGTVTLNTSGTVTLPNATDTLVGKATTDTLTNKTFDADGTGNSITNIENADIKAAAAIALNKLAATTVSRALVSDGSGFVSAATTTSTEIGYVNGVTSAIQTQLNALAFAPSRIIRGTNASVGGSTSGETTVLNFSAAILSTGSDITFTGRTTTAGDKYTINTTGVYSIWCWVRDNNPSVTYGITINSSGTSTAPQSLAASQVPSVVYTNGTSPFTGLMVATLPLSVNDIVRVQVETGSTLSVDAQTRFGITRVG